MQECSLLREHVSERKVVLGVNYELRDFQTRRKKRLDLVIAKPENGGAESKDRTFAQIGEDLGVILSDSERVGLEGLPSASEGAVGSVLAALEAKACMTAHVRALPRLHDELDSSHSTTHGNSERALAVGFVMVNSSPTFISPDRNKHDLSKTSPVVNQHRQPQDTIRVIEKINEIRRRSGDSGTGFDALGLMVCDMKNDGSPMHVVDFPDDRFPYSEMVRRLAHEYSAAFGRL